jgi:transcriptional regulator of heat shock response
MRGVNYHRGGKDYCYYVCTAYINGNACDIRKNISSKELDDAVWAELTESAKKKRGLSIYQTKAPTQNPKVKVDLEGQLIKLKNRQSAILKWVSDGTIEIESAEKDLQTINKELAATKNAINALNIAATTKEINAKDFLNAKTFGEKRRALIQNGFTVFAKRENGKTIYTIRA